MTAPYRLGIVGLGTVGAGVVGIVAREGAALDVKAGRPVRIVAVSARNRGRDPGVDISGFDWEDDPVRLAARDDIDCVIEVMGGSDGPALAAVETAIARGRDVVTANKAMLAAHGAALAAAADAAGVGLAGEASVAGGIPILKALAEGLGANRVTRVMGVLNGTCNYILTEMEETGRAYAEVLAEAQRLGYAEADPAMDVEGTDAAQKLAILAAIAFGSRIDAEGVVTEGIEKITLTDIAMARDMGFAIKLLAVARMHEGGLEQRVRPCMVPRGSVIGGLPGVTNAVTVEGDAVPRTELTGPGAGAGPTASAILADVLDLARGARRPFFGRPAAALVPSPRLEHAAEHSPYYLRFALQDRPGALASLASALGAEDVSIHRMRQYGRGDDAVPVVIVTHDARRGAIDAACARIAALPVSLAAPVAIQIEDL